MHTCTIYNSENAKVNEGIAGASGLSFKGSLKGVCSTATIRPVMMHLLILITAHGRSYYMHVKSTVASGNIAMYSWLDISIMSIPPFRYSAISPFRYFAIPLFCHSAVSPDPLQSPVHTSAVASKFSHNHGNLIWNAFWLTTKTLILGSSPGITQVLPVDISFLLPPTLILCASHFT